jgi:soluble lytic murein transglycosylase
MKFIDIRIYKRWQIPVLRKLFIIWLALLSYDVISLENFDPIIGKLHEQREIFKAAYDALQKRDMTTYQYEYTKLNDYPIKHYLLAQELLQKIRSFPKEDIRKFLDEHDRSAISDNIRYYWLEVLRKHNRWQDYLADYKESGATIRQRCYYQFARIKSDTSNKKSAIQAALKLWSSGNSQPKECDKLFVILIKDDLITEEIAWDRYAKSIAKRNYQLSKYVSRFIKNKDNKKLATKLYETYKNESAVINHNFFTPRELINNASEIHAAVTYGLVRLAKKNAQLASEVFLRYQKKYKFSEAERIKISSSLIKSLFKQKKKEESDEYLTKNIHSSGHKILEWRVRQSIQVADWKDAQIWIEKMPQVLKNKQVWKYWNQRLIEIIDGDAKNLDLSGYKKLSGERSFYGFLSAQRLGLSNNMRYQDSTPSQVELTKLESQVGIKSTRELLHHNLNLSARREWNKATRNFSKKQWISAAHISKKWLWHNGAITSMIKAGYWNDTNLRFPLAFKDLFEKNAKTNQIPMHLLMALARQESSFHHEATSPVGAKGLMQLMPATAKQVAGNNNISFDPVVGLYDARINIALGSLYFKKMLDRFNGNRILAIASYNAGPTRVSRWRKKTGGSIPFDAWIEVIPFNETRNYVQNVLAFSSIYAKKLNESEQMISNQEEITKL